MKILSCLATSLLLIIIFSSCRSQKAQGYLEDLKDTAATVQVKYAEPVIQKNDLLSIVVYSEATDGGKADALYNLPIVAGTATATTTPSGYIVDNDGYIQHQRLGRMKAEGLTKPQLAEEVRKKLTEVLTNPTVIVRLLNFRVTLLGEVAQAGQITIPSEKVTILEAVGLAGDLTIYGKKNDVRVLREVDGTVEHGVVDLSSKSLFDSPYYYLQQNDVVLVNPDKNKARLSDQVFNQRLGIAFSLINMIALLYNIFAN